MTYFGCFLIAIILPISGILEGNPLFAVTLVLVSLSSLATTILQKSLYGFLSTFPATYMQAFLVGQGFSGLTISSIYLLLKVTNDFDLPSVKSFVAALYFGLTLFFVCVALLCFLYFKGTSLYKEQLKQIAEQKNNLVASPALNGLGTVFGQIQFYAVSSFCVFALTMIMVNYIYWIEPISQSVSYYFIVCSFLLFDIGDVAGRILPSMKPNFRNLNIIAYLSWSRFLMIPVFMFSNVRDSRLPIFIKSDTLAMLLAFLTGFSKGYLGSMFLINTPKKVQARNRESVGIILTLTLIWGICFGSFVVFAFKSIHCLCNPFIQN